MTDFPKLKVVPFTGPNINDIPRALRYMADTIENGTNDGAFNALQRCSRLIWVAMDDDDQLSCGALGKIAGRYEGAGILQAAILNMLKDTPP
jgi:hypothetical protein